MEERVVADMSAFGGKLVDFLLLYQNYYNKTYEYSERFYVNPVTDEIANNGCCVFPLAAGAVLYIK